MKEPIFLTLDNPADLVTPIFNNLLGINNQGLIAGFYGSGAMNDPNQGFLLEVNHSGTGAFTAMDFPPAAQNPAAHPGLPPVDQTQLTGLNDNGIVVGYFYNTNMGVQFDNQFGFFEKDGVFTEVDNPKTPGLFGNQPPQSGVLIENQLIGVNDSKIAVGFYIDASGLSHGYTYDIKSGAFSANIDDPSAISGGIVVGSTVTAAINNAGDIAGFYTDTGPTNTASVIHGFVDNHGVFTTVNAPGATITELLGLNAQGIAVGFDVDVNGTHGIIYDTKTGTLTTVDAPNGINATTFNGINDKGDIVGFYTDTMGKTHGLLVETVGIILHHEV
jgi:hypothetical protein